jgi:hypothetical protein
MAMSKRWVAACGLFIATKQPIARDVQDVISQMYFMLPSYLLSEVP